jgi:peptide/nickel transport system permease protein
MKHILPNCLAPIIVLSTLTIGNSILIVSGLGFLGLGAKPGAAEWGVMLSNARGFLRSAPHVAMFPGVAIALTVLGFNLLGDGIRDVFDVRQK